LEELIAANALLPNSLMPGQSMRGMILFEHASEKGDIDNFPKCVLDGLVIAGVIHSDGCSGLSDD
jgi:hypothetical protein